ncbi:Leucine-rich repeat-containing G-protein coupled receptor 4 [Anthophora retusa]
MEHVWTLMFVLFFSAQLVSADDEYRRVFGKPSLKYAPYKHRTILTATTNPRPKTYRYDDYDDWRTKPDWTTPPSIKSPYKEAESLTIRTWCPNYTKQIEKYRAEMNSNIVLNLSSTGMQKLGNLFIESSYIKELYLNDNNITEISTMAFHGLPKLEVLTLSNNNISTDKLLYLKVHETLKTLLLDDNKYNSINDSIDQMFNNMPRLRELSLKRNGIARFSVNLKEFTPSLTKLYLSGNKIKSTDFLKNVPEKLTHLYLDDNNIETFSGYKLDNLQELFINENEITKLGNKEDYIDDDDKRLLTLDKMAKLVKLNVSSNKISDVTHDTFRNTTNLVELDLSNNKIVELPDNVFDALPLETLRINKNQLQFVPNLCSLDRLKSLDLSDNRIVAVTRESFCERQLKDTNEVFNTDNDSFRKFRMLQWLNLSGNRIVNFPVNLIREPSYLKVLLLKDNNIASINDLFDVRSYNLEELNVEGNPLLSLSISFMPKLTIHLMECKKTTELKNTTIETTTSDDTDY